MVVCFRVFGHVGFFRFQLHGRTQRESTVSWRSLGGVEKDASLDWLRARGNVGLSRSRKDPIMSTIRNRTHPRNHRRDDRARGLRLRFEQLEERTGSAGADLNILLR